MQTALFALLPLLFAAPRLPVAQDATSTGKGSGPATALTSPAPQPAGVNELLASGFQFGNHIDTHQQTFLLPNGELIGFLLITYTGASTANGFLVAKHPDGMTPPNKIVAGWFLRGKPGRATFVHHHMDHPLWLVASRNDIPQPGAYSHFHWTGAPGMAGMLVPGEEHDGYFLELTAIRRFAFAHAGEEIEVVPGTDLATHLNIVASFPGY